MTRTILISLMLACGTAQASEWVSTGMAEDGSENFVDVSSIRITGSIRRAWVRDDFGPNTKGSFINGSYARPTSMMVRFAFNCAEETVRFEASTWYYSNGTNSSASDV